MALGVVRVPLRRQRVRAHRLGTWQQHRVVNHALQRCGALVRAVQTGGVVDAVVGGSWGVAAAATRLSAPVVVCSWGVAAVGAARHLVAVYAEVIAAAAGAEGSRGEQVAGGGHSQERGDRRGASASTRANGLVEHNVLLQGGHESKVTRVAAVRRGGGGGGEEGRRRGQDGFLSRAPAR